MISLAFSIFLDMKISGVTLFGGMADWRNDGMEYKEYSRIRNMRYTLKRRIRENSYKKDIHLYSRLQ